MVLPRAHGTEVARMSSGLLTMLRRQRLVNDRAASIFRDLYLAPYSEMCRSADWYKRKMRDASETPPWLAVA